MPSNAPAAMNNAPAAMNRWDATSHEFTTLNVRQFDTGVLLVTLDRERSANTISAQMSREILRLTEAVTEDSTVRVVVLTGSGRFFCAGADLRDPTLGTPEWVSLGRQAVDSLEALSVPVIAAVNGPAFGGGTEIALACDFRIASEKALFSVPEIKIGMLPGAGGLTRLQYLVGPAKARRMAYSGCVVDAAEARVMGLADEVVAADELVDYALTRASELAEFAPYALAAAKKIFLDSIGMPIDEALAADYHTIDHMATPEQVQEYREKAAQRDPAYAKIFNKNG